ncbi:phosphatase PAP2 family protein [Candidatus Woesearchaeota archaeon]|nr:phosphatase PAP2 family protein [Candidatus Woesearchaeota archaeon]
MDLQLFQLVNNLAGENILLDNFFIFITFFGNLLLFVIILLSRDKKLILKCAAGFIIVLIIDFLINLVYYRARPFVDYNVNLLVMQKPTASFPSLHAMTAFLFAQLFYFWNKRYSVLVYLLAFLVAFSRIWLGVHYPLDVVGGVALGIIIAFITDYLFEKYDLMKKFKKLGLRNE